MHETTRATYIPRDHLHLHLLNLHPYSLSGDFFIAILVFNAPTAVINQPLHGLPDKSVINILLEEQKFSEVHQLK